MRAAYLRHLEARPLLVKSITSFFVLGTGDALTQSVLESKALALLDWRRSLRFAVLGLTLVGPSLHIWYGVLNSRLPGSSARAVATRVALDQLIFAPLFLSGFLTVVAKVEHKPFSLQNEMPSVLAQNWLIWVPVQLVNFSLVPPHLQVLFNNMVSVGWNAALSWQMHRKKTMS